MSMLKRVARTWDTLEALVYFALGTVLFVGLVVGWPLWVARDLFATQPALAIGVAAVCVLTLAVAVRDLVHRRWSLISAGIFLLWCLCVGVVVLAG
jgi:hypothetical protein